MSRNARHLATFVKDPIREFVNKDQGHAPIKPKKSLGALRKAEKTKPRSPDATGKLSLQRSTLAAIVEGLEKTGGEEVVCNIAGWKNKDQHGTYLTVEVSSRFVPHQQRTSSSDPFAFLDEDAGE